MKRLILSGAFTHGCIHSTKSVDSLLLAEWPWEYNGEKQTKAPPS